MDLRHFLEHDAGLTGKKLESAISRCEENELESVEVGGYVSKKMVRRW